MSCESLRNLENGKKNIAIKFSEIIVRYKETQPRMSVKDKCTQLLPKIDGSYKQKSVQIDTIGCLCFIYLYSFLFINKKVTCKISAVWPRNLIGVEHVRNGLFKFTNESNLLRKNRILYFKSNGIVINNMPYICINPIPGERKYIYLPIQFFFIKFKLQYIDFLQTF